MNVISYDPLKINLNVIWIKVVNGDDNSCNDHTGSRILIWSSSYHFYILIFNWQLILYKKNNNTLKFKEANLLYFYEVVRLKKTRSKQSIYQQR